MNCNHLIQSVIHKRSCFAVYIGVRYSRLQFIEQLITYIKRGIPVNNEGIQYSIENN
jgi:hypothetical protein